MDSVHKHNICINIPIVTNPKIVWIQMFGETNCLHLKA
jgi:hypothetical protein